MKVICINLNPKYKHHRKLKIGGVYNYHDGSVYLDKVWIGFYDKSLFSDLSKWRERQLKIILDPIHTS